MTIKTQNGKVITKDGKVSCECCGPAYMSLWGMTAVAYPNYILYAIKQSGEIIDFFSSGWGKYALNGYAEFPTGNIKFIPQDKINDQSYIDSVPFTLIKSNGFYKVIVSGSAPDFNIEIVDDDALRLRDSNGNLIFTAVAVDFIFASASIGGTAVPHYNGNFLDSIVYLPPGTLVMGDDGFPAYEYDPSTIASGDKTFSSPQYAEPNPERGYSSIIVVNNFADNPRFNTFPTSFLD